MVAVNRINATKIQMASEDRRRFEFNRCLVIGGSIQIYGD